MSRIISVILRRTVGILSGILGVLLILYSSYVIWDNFYSQKKAFASWDLLRFKPVISDDDDFPSFNDIWMVSEDAYAWLNLTDTNIDYPVMQGRDDYEYLNKDLYGNFSLSGSLYLTSANNSGFTDFYNIVYGHHMDNGAMFGNIDEFKETGYFNTHRDGVLITPGQIYDLMIFACVETVSYDSIVYNVNDKDRENWPEVLAYIRDKSVQFRNLNFNEGDEILVMSTCSDYETNGRLVLFARMRPRFIPLDPDFGKGKDKDKDAKKDLIPPPVSGHSDGYGGSHWSLVNLICLVLTVYLFLPLHCLKAKFGRRRWMIKENRRLKDYVYNVRAFTVKFWTGWFMELTASILAIVIFILHDDLRSPMVIICERTPWMIALLLITWIVDFIMIRYRKKKESNTEQVSEPGSSAAK